MARPTRTPALPRLRLPTAGLLCTAALAACSSEVDDALSDLEAFAGPDVEEARRPDPAVEVPDDAPRASVPVLGSEAEPVRRLGVLELDMDLTESDFRGDFGSLPGPMDAALYDRIKRPVLESCRMLVDVSIDVAFEVMDDPELRFASGLDAGEPISITAADGVWTRAERSSLVRSSGPQGYFDRRPAEGTIPAGALLEVPGAEFPAMRAELPQVVRPRTTRAGGANDPGGFVFDGRFEWSPGARPDVEWVNVVAIATLADDPFRGNGVACTAIDDGSFAFPAEAMGILEGNNLLGVGIDRRSDLVVRDGDAMLHVKIVAGLI